MALTDMICMALTDMISTHGTHRCCVLQFIYRERNRLPDSKQQAAVGGTYGVFSVSHPLFILIQTQETCYS
jgi:hypothetical protein